MLQLGHSGGLNLLGSYKVALTIKNTTCLSMWILCFSFAQFHQYNFKLFCHLSDKFSKPHVRILKSSKGTFVTKVNHINISDTFYCFIAYISSYDERSPSSWSHTCALDNQTFSTKFSFLSSSKKDFHITLNKTFISCGNIDLTVVLKHQIWPKEPKFKHYYKIFVELSSEPWCLISF